MVSVEKNRNMVIIYTFYDVKQAFFALDATSAPGPDGFGGSFFHTCWSIITEDLVKAVKSSRNHISKEGEGLRLP